jgi:ABC-2 type transport system permease protein
VGKLRAYWRVWLMAQKGRMEYRFNFFVDIFALFAGYVGLVANIWLMTNRFGPLAGWKFSEIAFLFGTFSASYGLSAYNFWQFTLLGGFLRTGEYDRYLLRPLNPVAYYAVERCQTPALGQVLGGLAIMLYCAALLDVTWTPARVAFVAVMLVAGSLIQAGVMLLSAASSFWTMESGAAWGVLYYPLREFCFYPLGAFARPIVWIATTVLPFAFVNYFPAQYLLGKWDMLGFPNWVAFASFPIAVAFFSVCLWCFGRGLRSYHSTGT